MENQPNLRDVISRVPDGRGQEARSSPQDLKPELGTNQDTGQWGARGQPLALERESPHREQGGGAGVGPVHEARRPDRWTGGQRRRRASSLHVRVAPIPQGLVRLLDDLG